MARVRRESKFGRAHISGGPKRRFAGELEGLKEALLPMKEQPGNRSSPYFVGMNEQSWSETVDNLHTAIQNGYMNANDVQTLLKVSPEEAERFHKYSRAKQYFTNRSSRFKNKVSRHKAKGVPHAFSSENVYNELLRANGFDSKLNNEIDDLATDLLTTIKGHDVLIDVQNRSSRGQDSVSLGVMQGLNGDNYGLGLDVWENSPSNANLATMFEKIRRNIRGGMSADNIDKLSASVEFAPEGYGKEKLIGGRYQPGDVQNIMNRPAQGSYDFVKPRDVNVINLNRLRNELMSMSKRDMIANEVRPIMAAEDKLKFGIPMQLVEALGALDGDLIDPELIKLVRR